MMSKEASRALYFRVLDANLNRLKEGIRVVEDIFRYVIEDREVSLSLKELRHSILPSFYPECISYRDSVNDILKPSIESEKRRGDLSSLVISNLKRAQEASRVLEEFCKLEYPKESLFFKSVRYELYAIEKKSLELVENLEAIKKSSESF